MNQIHPSLKFTLAHTTPEEELDEDKCECNKEVCIPFLDTLLSIKKNGRIEVDLHKKKETDRNQYILPSSCHPKATSTSIPYSLSLRIVRICTRKEGSETGRIKGVTVSKELP